MPCNGRPGSRAGYTLIEMATVFLLLALVVLLAAPALPRPRQGADAAARALAEVLQGARGQAVREARTVAVQLDLVSGAYHAYTVSAEGADSTTATGHLPPTPVRVTLSVPGGEAQATLRFGALGRAEGGPIEVRDAAGAARVVAVDPWTGSVRVEIR